MAPLYEFAYLAIFLVYLIYGLLKRTDTKFPVLAGFFMLGLTALFVIFKSIEAADTFAALTYGFFLVATLLQLGHIIRNPASDKRVQ